MSATVRGATCTPAYDRMRRRELRLLAVLRFKDIPDAGQQLLVTQIFALRQNGDECLVVKDVRKICDQVGVNGTLHGS